jgi:hypothetical protein
MLVKQPSTAFFVLAGLPGAGADHHFDRAKRRYAEQAKAQKAAKLPHTRITQSFAPCWTDGEPNLITCGRTLYGLEHKLKTERQLQFSDHDDRRLVSP